MDAPSAFFTSGIGGRGTTWRPAAPRSWRGLERLAQPSVHGTIERDGIVGDTQVPSPVDDAIVSGEQFGGERQRVADAEAELRVKLAHESELKERGVRNAPRNAAPFEDDSRYVVVREEVVGPFGWGSDRK